MRIRYNENAKDTIFFVSEKKGGDNVIFDIDEAQIEAESEEVAKAVLDAAGVTGYYLTENEGDDEPLTE